MFVNAGVIWPDTFARALDAMGFLSFDFGVIAGFVCLVDMSFYHSLLSTTLSLAAAVLAIITRSAMHARANSLVDPKKVRDDGIFLLVYVLLFAYPAVSVKVVETFAW